MTYAYIDDVYFRTDESRRILLFFRTARVGTRSAGTIPHMWFRARRCGCAFAQG